MKKTTIAALVLMATSVASFAQGYITFTASGSTYPIQYSLDGTSKTKVPSTATVNGYGAVNVGFYTTTSGTTLSLTAGAPDLSSWKAAQTIIKVIGPTAGNIAATSITTDASVSGGATVRIEAVAWTGTYTSFIDALAAQNSGAAVLTGWSGSTLSTGALGWDQLTGTSSSPASITKGTAAFNGLVLTAVPEPASFALAGLGAAALVIFRRRK